MPRLRIARADAASHPAERAYVVFSSSELAAGRPTDWFVGRGSQFRMCITDPSVSRPHLEVVFQADKFFLINRSEKGCEIDGRRVTTSDAPVAVSGNLSIKVGEIELRCTLLGDLEQAEVSSGALSPPDAVPSVDWWVATEPVARTPELASAPQESSKVPSVEEWYLASAQPSVIESVVSLGDSLDWTVGLTPAPADRFVPLRVEEPSVKPEVHALRPPTEQAANSATGAVSEVQTVVARILRAGGLRGDVAEVHAKALQPEVIGSLLEQLLGGLITTLSTRRTVKNSLRVAHTELRIEGNNPLKRRRHRLRRCSG